MPPRSHIRRDTISDLAGTLGIGFDELADEIARLDGDIASAAETFGGDLLDLFGPSRKPNRRTRRAFSGAYRREYSGRQAKRLPGESAREAAGGHIYEGVVERSAPIFVEMPD